MSERLVMERRAHWTDDLIEDVTEAGHSTDPPYWLSNAQMFNVIAAVEDWQDRTQQARATSMTDNEAAIARVRALAEQASTVIARGCTCPGNDCMGKCRRGEPMGWDLDPADVLRALEGDSDEPAGP